LSREILTRETSTYKFINMKEKIEKRLNELYSEYSVLINRDRFLINQGYVDEDLKTKIEVFTRLIDEFESLL
jgi:hypothetical protein